MLFRSPGLKQLSGLQVFQQSGSGLVDGQCSAGDQVCYVHTGDSTLIREIIEYPALQVQAEAISVDNLWKTLRIHD